MLSQARSLLSDSPNSDKVTLLTHDLTRAWPLSDACADVMFGDLVLEHLQTLDFFFSEAARWGGGSSNKKILFSKCVISLVAGASAAAGPFAFVSSTLSASTLGARPTTRDGRRMEKVLKEEK